MRALPAFALVLSLVLGSCAPRVSDTGEHAFEVWLAADPLRGPAFARFQALLRREGVAEVLTNRELWLTDRLAPQCIVEPFTMPPEALWTHIVPALRFIRDHVRPVIGEVAVASGYRDPAFNACVHGASQSAHLEFYALDLVPVDLDVTRERLIEVLCPIHEREGPAAAVGMGIYEARRFHIDTRRFRGWGADYRSVSFPCNADA